MGYSTLKFRRDILSCKELTAEEKLILSSVIVMNYVLANKESDCLIPTEHFVKLYGMPEEKVNEVIDGLIEKKYFSREAVTTIGGEVYMYRLNGALDSRFPGCLPENGKRMRRSRAVRTVVE